MMYFLKLCWKNVWRNRRRTLLTVNAIGVGVMALVAIHNYYDSFHQQIIDNVIRYQSGHLMIATKGYHQSRSASHAISDSSPLISQLDQNPQVTSSARRTFAPGLLSSPYGAANVVFVGIEPDREKQVTRYFANIKEGHYFENAPENAIVLGRPLADLLKARIGSKVVALTQGVEGSIGNELFSVCGIYETGADADKSTTFIRLVKARELLSLTGDATHQIALILKPETNVENLKQDIENHNPDLEALSWRDVQKHVVAIIDLDGAVNRLLLLIILLVAALGITNTILMSIMERSREFGIMMAIGTRTRELVGMVIGETAILCAIGVVIGNILGTGVTLFFGHTGFDLKWLTSQDFAIDGTVVQTICFPTLSWHNSLTVSLAVMSLSIVVALFPIRFISRLQTVAALRT